LAKHGKDIERWFDRVPERSQRVDDRYPQPPSLTKAAGRDRRNEGNYLADLREIARSIERDAAQTLRRYRQEVGELEADARLTTETLWQLHKVRLMSQALAGEDAELQSKGAILNDDLFHRCRARLLGFDD